MRNRWIIPVLVCFLQSCVKDKPTPAPEQEVQLTQVKKVYVVNEGNYGTGNASVSLYDPGNGSVVENFYQTQNNSTVGDVAQSLTYLNGKYYLVVNNSGKILVCDNTLKKTGQINGLMSPRYILQVSNQKAYVSDLYSNAISVVDLNSNSKIGSIACAGKTEQMVLVYNKVFITNTDKNYVYIINPGTDQLADSVYVGAYASGIAVDKQDKVWVLSSGNPPAVTARLSRINSLTNAVEATFTFGTSELPGNLCLNKTKDTLYYLNNGICRMPLTSGALPSGAFIARGSKNFYGLGVNPNDYSIYAADALDYSQRSNIYVYDPAGNQKTNFKAGINSNGFYFE